MKRQIQQLVNQALDQLAAERGVFTDEHLAAAGDDVVLLTIPGGTVAGGVRLAQVAAHCMTACLEDQGSYQGIMVLRGPGRLQRLGLAHFRHDAPPAPLPIPLAARCGNRPTSRIT